MEILLAICFPKRNYSYHTHYYLMMISKILLIEEDLVNLLPSREEVAVQENMSAFEQIFENDANQYVRKDKK